MTITKKLLKELKTTDNELTKYVINDILEHDTNEQENYIKDVMRGGCASGTVSSLIYYYDAKAFYIKYMDEIEDLYQQSCEETGETLRIGSPMFNWLAWFGYEQTMFNLLSTLDIEY